MFYWDCPTHRPTSTPEAETLRGLESARAYKEAFPSGYEPAVWIWDGAGWHSATVLARYWRPGHRTRLQVRVHRGNAEGLRVYAVRQPGLLPAHPGPRAVRLTGTGRPQTATGAVMSAP